MVTSYAKTTTTVTSYAKPESHTARRATFPAVRSAAQAFPGAKAPGRRAGASTTPKATVVTGNAQRQPCQGEADTLGQRQHYAEGKDNG